MWLPMAWRLFGARASTAIMLTYSLLLTLVGLNQERLTECESYMSRDRGFLTLPLKWVLCVMAWCLLGMSQYLGQCWLETISAFLPSFCDGNPPANSPHNGPSDKNIFVAVIVLFVVVLKKLSTFLHTVGLGVGTEITNGIKMEENWPF